MIITTIYPFKNGKRPITVGAGPEGELVSLRSGVFADWQALERQAYGELLTAASKPAPKAMGAGQVGKGRKTAKSGKRAKAAKAEMPADPEADAEHGESGPIGPAAPDLPEIEGDSPGGGADEAQLALELEGSDG
ncbi:MAG: hypothetical protein IT318_23915 [Anaerolineales bacterium]|nr:hypothetical protein [Anaerolineales bacterium]